MGTKRKELSDQMNAAIFTEKRQLPLLETSLANLLRRSFRGISRELELRIDKHGLSLGIWYFLRVLWETDGISQSELSDLLGVKGSTTVKAVDRMERLGLLTRKRCDRDKRRVIIELAPKGRALYGLIGPSVNSVVAKAAAGLSDIEVRELKRMLGVVAANVEAETRNKRNC